MMWNSFIPLMFLLVFLTPQPSEPIFQSSISLTPLGTAFLPGESIELVDVFYSVRSLIRCTMQCNQNRRCRTFDYDSSSRVCRLFEGQFSTGTALYNATFSSSRIGAISISTNTQIYSTYNQTCDQCIMDANRYLECMNGFCQCPLNNFWNVQACLNQVYNGSHCNHSFPSCRQDFNLTCSNITNTCEVPQPTGTATQSAKMCFHHQNRDTFWNM